MRDPPWIYDPQPDGWRFRLQTAWGPLLLVGAGLVTAALVVVLTMLALNRQGVQDDFPLGRATVTFDPPAPLPPDGQYVESRVLPSGVVAVQHWIRSRKPLAQVTLAMPGPDGWSARPMATQVRVVADGTAFSEEDLVGDRVSYLPRPARTVYVAYLLTGVVDVTGSVAGRALVWTTALDLSYAGERGPSTVAVVGTEVLSMACTRPVGVSGMPQPCGAPEDGAWRVVLRDGERHDRVMVQINLDRTPSTRLS